ncbi:MAG: hypothetical protein ACRC17_09760 [Culicoidibacterales bacterium]
MKNKMKRILTMSILAVALTVTAAPLTSFASETSNIQTRAMDHGGQNNYIYCTQHGKNWGNFWTGILNGYNAYHGSGHLQPYCGF